MNTTTHDGAAASDDVEDRRLLLVYPRNCRIIQPIRVALQLALILLLLDFAAWLISIGGIRSGG